MSTLTRRTLAVFFLTMITGGVLFGTVLAFIGQAGGSVVLFISAGLGYFGLLSMARALRAAELQTEIDKKTKEASVAKKD